MFIIALGSSYSYTYRCTYANVYIYTWIYEFIYTAPHTHGKGKLCFKFFLAPHGENCHCTIYYQSSSGKAWEGQDLKAIDGIDWGTWSLQLPAWTCRRQGKVERGITLLSWSFLAPSEEKHFDLVVSRPKVKEVLWNLIWLIIIEITGSFSLHE